MDRPLLRDKDYVRFQGEAVEVSLYRAWEGKKSYEGTLVALKEDSLIIRDEKDRELAIPREQVSKTKLAVIF